MSRKDLILALAMSKTPVQPTAPPALSTKKISANASATTAKQSYTDINKLWSRPDEDFPAINGNKNEYENSFSFIQSYDLRSIRNQLLEDTTLNSTSQHMEPTYTNNMESTPQQIELTYASNMDSTHQQIEQAYTNNMDYTPQQIELAYTDNMDSTPQPMEPTCINMVSAPKQMGTTYTNNINATPQQMVADVNTTQIEHTSRSKSTRQSLKCFEMMISSDEEQFIEDSDDSVVDKNYYPNLSDSDSNCSNTQRNAKRVMAVEVEVHSCVQRENRNTQQYTSVPSAHHVNTIESFDTIAADVIELEESASMDKGLTKAGLPRKRRKFEEPLAERVKQKNERELEKLSLKPPCGQKCRKGCSAKFTEEMRIDIHDRYVKLNWEGRGLFIKGFVLPKHVNIRTSGNTNPKRQITYKYFFNKNLERIEVCKVFFLSTLGYNPKNDRHLHLALKKPVDMQQDKRGTYERQNVIDKDIIKNHIQNFQPTISHYRREHAPLRLYLPSDINITLMHQKYMEQYPDQQISLETYRQVVKELNISFANLGNEECEQCALFKQHKEINECVQDPESCEKCNLYFTHKIRYETSRKEYNIDKTVSPTDKCIYYSVDLQKVIMLPRMDQYKVSIFCPRIIAFNESFVPLGSSKNENLPFAVLWNDTISGRNQEDIISAYRAFLIHKRDIENIVLWADNCAAQNKNWALLCFLINMINSEFIAPESITIKYFEPGHSFMSADHFHHQVESQLRKKKKVYDFDDYVDTVKLSNAKKNEVKVMTITDFYDYEDCSSQHRIRKQEPRVYLKDLTSVKVQRGQFQLQYKTGHDLEWQELDFLQMKIKKSRIFPVIRNKTTMSGISSSRKAEIISKLVPLMPETRRYFWQNLTVSDRT